MELSGRVQIGVMLIIVIMLSVGGFTLLTGDDSGQPQTPNEDPREDNFSRVMESKSLILQNNFFEEAQFDVEVVREIDDGNDSGINSTGNASDEGEIVHSTTTNVPPSSGTVVYNTAQLEDSKPDNLTVTVSYESQTKSVNLRTTECYKDIEATISSAGNLTLTSDYTC